MASTLLIAVAQCRVTRDIAANGVHIRELVAEAAGRGASIVLFPEGALSGYAKAQLKSWADVDWTVLRAELAATQVFCAEQGVTAVVGSAHPLGEFERPHNSLYVVSPAVSPEACPETRYDKRLLSSTEINDWYTPGFEPVMIERNGLQFGFTLCIEASFPELFAGYEAAGADCVLHATYGFDQVTETLLRAHAATTSMWLAIATPANAAGEPSGVIGPTGEWIARCGEGKGIAVAALDRSDPRFAIALKKARPWRRVARAGDIYRERRSASPRSLNRTAF
jgi:predicted amidohydrolase